MVGRSVRIAFLTLAAWAVLFAPGAAASEGGGDPAVVEPDQVASAMVAPTFGPDGVVIARTRRPDHEPTRGFPGPAGDLSRSVDLAQDSIEQTVDDRSDVAHGNERTRSVAMRAPPEG
ncbi:hypothetical protein [Actinospongicola halichondriae]|uniref:hypothetical protein n=1 Tax=Actinospongicola halichondriae TaxID=3236844 RepID=UPI003D3752A7